MTSAMRGRCLIWRLSVGCICPHERRGALERVHLQTSRHGSSSTMRAMLICSSSYVFARPHGLRPPCQCAVRHLAQESCQDHSLQWVVLCWSK